LESGLQNVPASPISLCHASRPLLSEIPSEFAAQTYVKLHLCGAIIIQHDIIEHITPAFAQGQVNHKLPFQAHRKAAPIRPDIISISIMKYANMFIAMISTIAPAVCLPANSFTRQFELPTCGAVSSYDTLTPHIMTDITLRNNASLQQTGFSMHASPMTWHAYAA
jgi:hypothetical protein